jgi:hyperosmotically inducible periplasmic protein
MKTALPLTLIVIACSAMAACSREETSREAREAAAGVKTVAARAGDRLADSWLTAKVQAKFFADDDIKARYIDVSSRDGNVTLKGFVESDAVRQEAIRIARTTDGVTHVEDRLLLGQAPQTAMGVTPASAPVGTSGSTVMPRSGAAAVPNDSMVTSLIQSKYFVDPRIKMRSIDVSTTSGVVTLRGNVASDNERAQALLMARTTEGVERVEDALTIDASLATPVAGASGAATGSPLPSTPIAGAGVPAAAGPAAPQSSGVTAAGASGTQPADASLETTIRSKLAGDAQLKAARLEVSARAGVVLLQGTVATQALKQKALTLAREGPGVVQVIDRIKVAR